MRDTILHSRVCKTCIITIGREREEFARIMDSRRIERQNRRSWKETRTARQTQKTAEIQSFYEEKGLLYGPGIAD